MRCPPRTTATVLDCPLKWLSAKVGSKPRWEVAHGHGKAPAGDLTLPTRFLRVLYFLKDDLYEEWRREGVPAPHEFAASYSSIESYTAPKMQEFLRRMSPEQHFYSL